MRVLGTEVAENGVMLRAPDKGDCISKAARRQRDSVGMIKLVTMPTFTAVGFLSREPICSIQPPRNAKPYSLKTIPPVARAGMALDPAREMVITTRASRQISDRPVNIF